MKLTSDQFQTFVEALVEVYLYPELKALVRTKLGYKLEGIVAEKGMDEVAEVLIAKAQEEHWHIGLLRAVRDDKEGHPKIEKLYAEVEAFAADDPFDTHLLHGHRAFIDRKRLRKYVRKLHSPLWDRILVVTGEGRTGKTYTKDYVYYLEERLPQIGEPGFKVLWVDLERLGGGTREAPAPISALDLALRIASQAGLELTQKLEDAFDEERHPRWVGRFADWLTGEISLSADAHWLLIDAFETCILEQGSRELIEELADRVANNLKNFRLVLLGYTHGLTHIRGKLYEDTTLELINSDEGREEIGSFIVHLHELAGRSAAADRQDAVAQDARQILEAIDPDDPERHECLGNALTEKAVTMLGGAP